MIVASYVFYAWWDWRFVFLLAGCTLWNQVLAVRIWRSRDRHRKALLLALALAGEPRCTRLLQVLRLLRQLDRQRGHDRRPRPAGLGEDDRPAGRDLVLHLHGDQLRRRHLPRRVRAHHAREVRRLPVVLPAPRGRADRAPGRADPAVRLAPRPAPRGHEPGLLPDRHRAVQEGGDRQLPGRGNRRRRVRGPQPALVARDPDRRLRLRSADLRRLLRVHGHGHRHGPPAGLRLPAELRLPVRGDARCRTSGAAGT